MSRYAQIHIGDKTNVVVLGEEDRIIRKKSIDRYNQLKEEGSESYEVWDIQHFYKGNIAELQALMKSLSVYEKAFLFSVVTYVGYDDCCLKWNNNKCIDFDSLLKISGFSKGKLSEVLNSLRHKDIIYKGLNSLEIQYFMNPWLFYRGTKIEVALKTMFKNYKIKVKGNVKWGDLKDR